MGGAHEDSALDHKLVLLNNFLVNHQELYFQVLAFDAELALEIGERVLDHAEHHRGYRRASRPAGFGDSTIVLRIQRRNAILGEMPLLAFYSPTAEATITISLRPQSAIFQLVKRGTTVVEMHAPDPPNAEGDADLLFALSYSSSHQKVRTISNDRVNGQPIAGKLEWLSHLPGLTNSLL